MGVIGQQIGEYVGRQGGSYIGSKLGGKKGSELGSKIGSVIGNFAGSEVIPFKKGGMVRPKGKRKTMKAILHRGEMVVPASMVSEVPKKLKNKIAKRGGRAMKK